jgi:serine/threonine-protein kinase
VAAVDATRIEPLPEQAETLRSTIPPRSDLARTFGADLSATRRPSLIASLSGSAGPLPDRYEEGRVLGKGGMGVVVLATDRDLARSVAVKKLDAGSNGPELVDRFLREAQVTAQLEHPGILPVHDVGVDDQGHFFYVMRLVKGDRTLRRLIDRLRAGDPEAHREFTFQRRAQLVQQVARILHYAHAKGVIHRDVKPENIMLGSFGEVYLVDWGLAKVAGAEDGPTTPGLGGAPDDQTSTRVGSIVGTPRYMAPEQANGESATALSDVYSLTAVLYELLSLRHYLDGGEASPSLEKLIQRIVTAPHVRANAHYDPTNGRVPQHLSFICDRGLAKKPGDRFQSAEQLEVALEDWLEGVGPIVCPVTFQLRLMTLYRRAIETHPTLTGFLSFFLPLGLLLAYGGFRLYGFLVR